jgi:hypothetical protein
MLPGLLTRRPKVSEPRDYGIRLDDKHGSLAVIDLG